MWLITAASSVTSPITAIHWMLVAVANQSKVLLAIFRPQEGCGLCRDGPIVREGEQQTTLFWCVFTLASFPGSPSSAYTLI